MPPERTGPARTAGAALATYPVLAVAGANAGEFSVGELAATGAVFALLGLLAGVAIGAILRQRSRATATTVQLVGILWLFVSPVVARSAYDGRARWGLAACTVIAAAFVVLSLKRPVVAERSARPMLLLASVLPTLAGLALVRASIVQHRHLAGSATADSLAAPLRRHASVPASGRPDIYLIIVDSRGSAASLREIFDHQTGAFEDSLRALGFAIPGTARSNYAWTSQSVASILNFAHVTALEGEVPPAERSSHVLYSITQDNRLSRFLRDRGYRIIAQPAVGFPGTRRNASAHVDGILPGVSRLRMSIAQAHLASTAVLLTVPGLIAHKSGAWPTFADVLTASFDGVEAAVALPGPKFVVLHTLIAHEPYLFDSSCRAVGGVLAATAESYVRQIECLNMRVLSLASKIDSADSSAVVLLQADHGSGTKLRPDLPAEQLSPDAARERFAAFGAYRLPGIPSDSIAAAVTPVNVVRLVLRHYLHADLPAVPDDSYYASAERPYHFVRVPDSVFAASSTDGAVTRAAASPALEMP